MFLLLIVAVAATVFVLISSSQMQAIVGVVVAMFALLVEVICLKGLLIVNPNEGQVLQLFGTYVGTLRDQGLRWVNPFTTKRRISLRVRNFETSKLKVNDLDGNPIEIAAVVAGAMLQRQQASAIISARQTIVEGAVSIVQMALDQLSERKVVELDPERRAAMVSNLLVVLCGERSPQPVVNAGSLYS
jgi:regulator of protease activity HflC (stomatin/prohibitin superfamily)